MDKLVYYQNKIQKIKDIINQLESMDMVYQYEEPLTLVDGNLIITLLNKKYNNNFRFSLFKRQKLVLFFFL
jgi:hypothetical protein